MQAKGQCSAPLCVPRLTAGQGIYTGRPSWLGVHVDVVDPAL